MSQKTPVDSVKELGPDATKGSIREAVWRYIEDNDLADFPRPVNRRIPNVKGAATAAEIIPTMQEFKRAQTVKINPDKPQEQARYLTLDARKNLLVPTPRLRAGLFNKITPPDEATKDTLRICSTSQGVREYSKPVSLDDRVTIDLVITGCVAVSRTGARLGKGEGFADLEWAMMRSMGAVQRDTVVITTVHECQIVDIPEALVEDHDITVDYIVTDREIIKCSNNRLKPNGIVWSKLEPNKLRRIPILRKLMQQEREAGIDVTLKDGQEFDLEAAEKEDKEREEREEEDGGDRRRRYFRYNRYRRGGNRRFAGRGRGRRSEGDEGDDEKEELEGEGGGRREGEGGGRRYGGRGRGRGRRSEGEEGDDKDGEDRGDDEDRPRRFNRRFRRRRPGPRRSDEDRKTDEEGAGDRGSDDDKAKPPRRRFRPRRGRQPTLFVGGLPRSLRCSTFKAEVRGNEVDPLKVIWKGGNGHAFLQFENKDLMETAIEALAELNINGKKLRVERAKELGGRMQEDGGGEGEGQVEGQGAANGDATEREKESVSNVD